MWSPIRYTVPRRRFRLRDIMSSALMCPVQGRPTSTGRLNWVPLVTVTCPGVDLSLLGLRVPAHPRMALPPLRLKGRGVLHPHRREDLYPRRISPCGMRSEWIRVPHRRGTEGKAKGRLSSCPLRPILLTLRSAVRLPRRPSGGLQYRTLWMTS